MGPPKGNKDRSHRFLRGGLAAEREIGMALGKVSMRLLQRDQSSRDFPHYSVQIVHGHDQLLFMVLSNRYPLPRYCSCFANQIVGILHLKIGLSGPGDRI